MRGSDLWVIDSSVSGKWYLADEDFRDQAQSFWSRHERGEIVCVAPYFSRHEVASLLTNAAKSGRITWESAHQELGNYIAAGVSQDQDHDWLMAAAIDTARRLSLGLYDAFYVALADALGGRVVTADRRMRDGVAGQIPFLTWLGDVTP